MRSPFLRLLACLLFFVPVLAVFKDDAYVTDWHKALIGPSLQSSTFFQRPHAASKATLIYTLTSRSVLAAINPKDGEIVWRQSLDISDYDGVARSGSGVVVAAVGGSIKSFDAANGKLAWSNDFSGLALDVRATENSVVVLFDDRTVRMLDGKTGAVKWENMAVKLYVDLYLACGTRADYKNE